MRLEIAYAYIWSRRADGLDGLKHILAGVDPKLAEALPRFPDETRSLGVREALRRLLAAKTVLDHIVLALRRPETVRPTQAKRAASPQTPSTGGAS